MFTFARCGLCPYVSERKPMGQEPEVGFEKNLTLNKIGNKKIIHTHTLYDEESIRFCALRASLRQCCIGRKDNGKRGQSCGFEVFQQQLRSAQGQRQRTDTVACRSLYRLLHF